MHGNATARLALEDIRVEGKGFRVFLGRLLVLLLREVGGPQIAVERSGIIFQLDGLLILFDRPTVIVVEVILQRANVVVRLGVLLIHLDGPLEFALGFVLAHHLEIGYANLVVQNRRVGLGDGSAVVIQRVGKGFFRAKIVTGVFQLLGSGGRRRRL